MAPLKDKVLFDCWPHKALYRPGEEVRLVIRRDKEAFAGEDISLRIHVYRLHRLVREISGTIPVKKASENPKDHTISLGDFNESMSGFGVEVRDDVRGVVKYTAFDMAEKSREILRYGFLSDFSPADREDTADLDALLAFHLNMVQFYDWAYRHHQFLSEDQIYRDLMGKVIDFSTIREKIGGCHERGMMAIGYGAVYAAGKDYHDAHPEEGLYTSAGDPWVFIDRFYIMNLSRENPWRARIIGEYRRALDQAGFDGIHMDTYGFPKTAFDVEGRHICLEKEYPGLIADTRKEIAALNPEGILVFNNVGNWPMGETARAPQDVVYIEVWPPYTNYEHIRQIILDARSASGDTKTVIIAAYIAPFRTGKAAGALCSALLLFSTIVSHGATHLFLGENNGVLTQGYYSDYTLLSGGAVKRLREYHDFAVRYGALFYDPLLKDVSMTHTGGDNQEYCCFSRDWSPTPEPGKRWLVIREGAAAKLISIIKLSGCGEICWNTGKPDPVEGGEIAFSIQVDFEVKGIWQADPEQEGGAMSVLPWTRRKTNRGYYIDFTVPRTGLWTLVYIELLNPIFSQRSFS